MRLLCCYVLALFTVASAQDPLEVKFKQSGVQYVKLGEKLQLDCQVNQNLLTVVNNFEVETIHQSAGNSAEIVLFKMAKPQAANLEYYSLNLTQTMGNGINVEFKILFVREQDEGAIICRVTNTNTKEKAEAKMEISVLRPLDSLQLKFGNNTPITKDLPEPIEVDPGIYRMVCIAEGSNPEPQVELCVNSKCISDVNSTTQNLMTVAIKKRKTITRVANIKTSSSLQEVQCDAKSQYGDTKSVKLKIKVKKYDPTISCKDIEAYEGQPEAILICIVDYEGLTIKDYRLTNEDGEQTKDFDEVTKEQLSDTKFRVQWRLKNTESWHFNRKYYFVIEKEDGHITRQYITLRKIPGESKETNGSSRMFGASLTIFIFACILWILSQEQ